MSTLKRYNGTEWETISLTSTITGSVVDNDSTVTGATVTDALNELNTNKASNSTVTTSANGLMISTDKSKLDGIEANANNYSLPVGTSASLGGVKSGSNVEIDSAGLLSVNKVNISGTQYQIVKTTTSGGTTGCITFVVSE